MPPKISPRISDADSPPRLVVFDFDGTLVDSQQAIIAAMTAAWEAHGLSPPDDNAIRRVVGLSLVESMAVLLPEGEAERHHALAEDYKAAFHRLRARPDHDEPLYPGAAEALDCLEDCGFLLAIATGKSLRGLSKSLERLSLTQRFHSLQTADMGAGKPNPDMLLRAMDAAAAAPGDTVMIGDTVFDMEMAAHAGVRALGVEWGYHEGHELKAAGAHAVLGRFAEVPAAVHSLLTL